MQNITRFIFVVFFVISTSIIVSGQISQGGLPMQVTLKSAEKEAIKMPVLPKNVIAEALSQNNLESIELKPFRFAHPFEVDLSPENSGNWYLTDSGYNVWQLTIESDDALSLNLIFDNFELIDGGRLFIYNEEESEYLGAFTSGNNKRTGKFAVSPVVGDNITIQYEVPEEEGTPSNFNIIRVNHDFVGILKSERRPMGVAAGDCNIDVNCDMADKYWQPKNSVCRLIVDGIEICSGTLINNTAEDQKPYILSASHCYDEWDLAETTVYTFNYESPYCAPLDGDPLHSISGAVMKAQFDSLDFALAEMSTVPPPSYRPYFAGWNHSGALPDSAASIHHPQGDVKKIALDYDELEFDDFSSKYTSNGFLKVLEWDEGVTEIGSSGGALFNTDMQLIGTLTGGAATCHNPVNDYYARFDMYWDYKSDSTKQVKCWLDPSDSGADAIDGKQFYEGSDLCKAFTNLTDDDEHGVVQLTTGGNFSGYWGGTNEVGITEIVECFSIAGNESLAGVSIGVGKLARSAVEKSDITVKVYNGDELPESLIYSKVVELDDLVNDAMNYIEFEDVVEPDETFFVGFELSNVQVEDTFAVYQSLRLEDEDNSFFYKLSGNWVEYSDNANSSMANVMELVACNYSDSTTDTPFVNEPVNVWLFPNPVKSALTVESDQEIIIESLSVYNMIGQEINVPLLSVEAQRIQIDLSGNTPGVYIVRFGYDDSFVTRKFSYVPH